MKNVLFILFFLYMIVPAHLSAQYVYDSSIPYFICNAPNIQTKVQSLPINSNSTITFWIDKRNGTSGTALYAQVLDSDGVPAFSANGKLVIATIGKEIFDYRVTSWQSGFLISWMQGPTGVGADSLFAQLFDVNVNPIWLSPTLVAESGTLSQIYLSTINGSRIQLMESATDMWITWVSQYVGGSAGLRYNKLDQTGALQWPINGQSATPTGYAPYVTCSDSLGGFYMMFTTGGVNASMFLQRYDDTGGGLFANPINLTSGFDGRGYKWGMFADGASNYYLIWDSGIGDILITKRNGDGSPAWSPAVKTICTANNSQINVHATLHNSTIYSTWSDARPPASNYFIFTHKTDTSGNNLWSVDGEQISSLASYIPDALVAPLSGGNILNTYLTNAGFNAQRIQANGNTQWQINGTPVYNGATSNNPNYDDFNVTPVNNNAAVIVWSNGVDILAAKVLGNGILASVGENEKENERIPYPNPVQDIVYIDYPFHELKLQIEILDINGRIVLRSDTQVEELRNNGLNVSKLSSGLYTMRIHINQDTHRCKLLKL